MIDMKRVIIESPYAGDVAANEEYACLCMADSLARGEAPFLSHLLYTQALDDTDADQRKQGIDAGFAWRNVADNTVVYIDRGISSGMRAGIANATGNGHDVEYRSLSTATGRSSVAGRRYHRGELLGLTGIAYSGKTSTAKQLVAMGAAVRVRFAGPIKDALKAIGLTEAQVDGDEKDIPCELLGGKTPRHAMQTLGTEWGRGMIDDGIWLRCAVKKTQELRTLGFNVVVDDMRFDNEAKALRTLGGTNMRISRSAVSVTSTHASEDGVSSQHVDYVIDNNGELVNTTAAVLNNWLSLPRTEENPS